MAIIPETQYVGKIEASSSEYPYGKARNITVPGDGTGTPWEQALANDVFGFQQALLAEAGITPSGNPDEVGTSDYLDVLTQLYGYTVSQSVNGYIQIGEAGLLIQWGTSSVVDGSYVDVAMNIAFPTEGLWGSASPFNSTGATTPLADLLYLDNAIPSTTLMRVRGDSASGAAIPFNWLAVGR